MGCVSRETQPGQLARNAAAQCWDRFVGSFAMPEDPPRACSEAAECGHPGTPARRCQPQLGPLTPLTCHRPPASQQPRDRPVPSVCRLPGRRTELSARSGRHVRTPRGKSDSMTLTAEVRSRETPAILKRPLPRADTPASCVLSNLGAAGRGCSPRPRRPPDPLSGVEGARPAGSAVQPCRELDSRRHFIGAEGEGKYTPPCPSAPCKPPERAGLPRHGGASTARGECRPSEPRAVRGERQGGCRARTGAALHL